jgi:hypothetical protein
MTSSKDHNPTPRKIIHIKFLGKNGVSSSSSAFDDPALQQLLGKMFEELEAQYQDANMQDHLTQPWHAELGDSSLRELETLDQMVQGSELPETLQLILQC